MRGDVIFVGIVILVCKEKRGGGVQSFIGSTVVLQKGNNMA